MDIIIYFYFISLFLFFHVYGIYFFFPSLFSQSRDVSANLGEAREERTRRRDASKRRFKSRITRVSEQNRFPPLSLSLEERPNERGINFFNCPEQATRVGRV